MHALEPKYQRRLGLTGTLERQLDDGVERHLLPYFGRVGMRYGYADALRDKVVAPFHLALVGVDFSLTERRDYTAEAKRCNDAMVELVNHFSYPSDWQAFFAQVTARVSDNTSWWDDERQFCSTYVSGFAERRRIMAEAGGKESLAGELAQGMASLSGTLVFTETKESAHRLAYVISRTTSAFPVTSGSSSSERQDKLRSFSAGRLKVLCAPRILDEGIDVPEAELALIVAASQTPRQMIQRMGRVIRFKSDRRPARIVILYVRETGEDPEGGGHFGFLKEVRPHAASETVFDASGSVDVLRWLSA